MASSRGYPVWYRGGQIIDASLVNVPKNRNTRDEQKHIEEDKTPDGWNEQPNMKRQKNEDARWTKKHGKSYLRPQEPHQRRQGTQADSALCGHRCYRARQPGAR